MTFFDPEPWQTNAAAPFLVIETERGAVSVWSLGRERFRVEAPHQGSEVEAFDRARTRAAEPDADDCPDCEGSGECPACNGSGVMATESVGGQPQ